MIVRVGMEWSTSRLSVAVCSEQQTIERTCKVDRFQAPEALNLFMEVLKDASVSANQITEIRIGRGPGNTTGVRQSFAFATGLSISDSVPVLAVNSGTILAADVSSDSEPFWVMGDARRGFWWGAQFPDSNPQWQVLPPEQWTDLLYSCRIFSSEPQRLGDVSVAESYPSASTLLALDLSDLHPEPLEPLYVHKAV